jgi:hypothetical protein
MLLFPLVLCACTLQAQDSAFLNHTPAAKRLWHVSLASLAAANVMDVQSSWGKHELNSPLASANGTFGARGALMKSGFQGGLMGLEMLVLRRHPNRTLCRFLAVVNFGAAAVVAGTTVHNYGVPR